MTNALLTLLFFFKYPKIRISTGCPKKKFVLIFFLKEMRIYARTFSKAGFEGILSESLRIAMHCSPFSLKNKSKVDSEMR